MKKIFTLAMASALALGASAAIAMPQTHVGGLNIKGGVQPLEQCNYQKGTVVRSNGNTVSKFMVAEGEAPEFPQGMTQFYEDPDAGPMAGIIDLVPQENNVFWLEGFCSYFSDYRDENSQRQYPPVIAQWGSYESEDGGYVEGLYIEGGQILYDFVDSSVNATFAVVVYWVDQEHGILMSEATPLIYENGNLVSPVFAQIELSNGSVFTNCSFSPALLLEVTKSSNSQFQVGDLYSLNSLVTEGYTIFAPNSTITYDLWHTVNVGTEDAPDYQWQEYSESPLVMPLYLEWDNSKVYVTALDPETLCNVVTMDYNKAEGYAEFFDQCPLTYDGANFYVSNWNFEDYDDHGTYIETSNISDDGMTFEFGPWALIATVDNDYYFFRGASKYMKIELGQVHAGIDNVTVEPSVDANAPVEYFNLQGMRVNNPENGLFVRRQGNKAQKVIL